MSNFKEWKLPSFGKEWDRDLQAESTATKGKFYIFNLHRRTCSCRTDPNWNPMCRHQARYVADNASSFNLSPVESGIFDDYYGTKYYLRGTLSDGRDCIFSFGSSSEWVNIYIQKGRRYAYSLDEQRWARGEEPTDPSAIISAINANVVPYIEAKEGDDILTALNKCGQNSVPMKGSPDNRYQITRRGKNGEQWAADEATLKEWIANGKIQPMDEIYDSELKSRSYAKNFTIGTASAPATQNVGSIVKVIGTAFSVVVGFLILMVAIGTTVSSMQNTKAPQVSTATPAAAPQQLTESRAQATTQEMPTQTERQPDVPTANSEVLLERLIEKNKSLKHAGEISVENFDLEQKTFRLIILYPQATKLTAAKILVESIAVGTDAVRLLVDMGVKPDYLSVWVRQDAGKGITGTPLVRSFGRAIYSADRDSFEWKTNES